MLQRFVLGYTRGAGNSHSHTQTAACGHRSVCSDHPIAHVALRLPTLLPLVHSLTIQLTT